MTDQTAINQTAIGSGSLGFHGSGGVEPLFGPIEINYETAFGTNGYNSYGFSKNLSIGERHHEIITIGGRTKNPQKDTIYIGEGTRKIILVDQTQEEIDLIKTIKDLSNELNEMKTLVKALQTHIDYMPGGRGYEEAKRSFESAMDKN